ncbi:cation:proton antiporter [Helicobacter sp. 14348-15]|uniref:cation:proton antiporter n=1 Tax=Helicobacter colisuis TaxID=2949739 RepID=UPI002029C6A2|nr:cation:proton antiporter [Helicobacter colisuis]MCL9821312.1 cation:proton antiporter [Helicobacter colisuis]MCL9822717.1 cation:proton antiporter [Helicobacter colisuis]
MKLEILSSENIALTFLSIAILLLSAFIWGKIFVAIKSPKVIGEIFGGFVLGASGLYLIVPDFINGIFQGYQEQSKVLNVFYQLGLVFLMFVAGFNTNINFERKNLKIITLLFFGATFIPMVIGYFFIVFFINEYIGVANNDFAFSVVFLVAITVTSIPVISKIFFDIGIIRTRFASIILTTSTIQDLFLWIMLNTAINAVSGDSINIVDNFWTAILTVALFALAKVLSKLLRCIKISINFVDFLTITLAVLFFVIWFLNFLHINLMYSSFLVGFLVKNTIKNNNEFKEKMRGVSDFLFSYFIPIYFALIGMQLNIVNDFSYEMFIFFAILAFLLELFGSYIALFCVKMKNISRINFSITMNARGGPGIVLASVAYYYGIININFFTTLILVTLLSSMIAGYWLKYQYARDNNQFNEF